MQVFSEIVFRRKTYPPRIVTIVLSSLVLLRQGAGNSHHLLLGSPRAEPVHRVLPHYGDDACSVGGPVLVDRVPVLERRVLWHALSHCAVLHAVQVRVFSSSKR